MDFLPASTLQVSGRQRSTEQRPAPVRHSAARAEGGGRGSDSPARAHLALGQRLAPVSLPVGDAAAGPAGRCRRRAAQRDAQDPQGGVSPQPGLAPTGHSRPHQPHPARQQQWSERLVRGQRAPPVPTVHHGADRLPGAGGAAQLLQAGRQPIEQLVRGPGGSDGLHAVLRRLRARDTTHVTQRWSPRSPQSHSIKNHRGSGLNSGENVFFHSLLIIWLLHRTLMQRKEAAVG